jgi:hypothetical protein
MCRGKVTELEEAEKHMTEATARFRQVMSSEDAAEAQNVPDIYLEPIRQVVPLNRARSRDPLDPDPHKSKKLDPDPLESQNSKALEAENRAMEGRGHSKWRHRPIKRTFIRIH